MEDIRMIATDMDGTFLADDKHYDIEWFAKLLDIMKEKNIRFVAASGNQIQHLRKMLQPILDRGYQIDYVASNGALIEANRQLVHASVLTKDQMRKVIEWNANTPANSENLVILNGIKGSYVSNHATDAQIKEISEWYHDLHQVEKFAEVDDDILEVTFLWGFFDDVSAHVEELRKIFGDSLHATGSGFGSVDILAPGANKATGLQYLQDRFDIENEQVIVFGDNQNDLEMLHKYDHAFVMPNAEEFMKRQIPQLALSDNQSDGVL
jgi:Cof subfamily protein (haloacid dehalogenase superfamily)